MNDLNRVSLTGRLGRDPDSRNGACKFTLAVDGSYKKDGEKVEKTHWIDCVMFGKGGEWFAENMKKGTRIAVDGSLSYSSWESDGGKRSKVEVMVEQFFTMSKPAV